MKKLQIANVTPKALRDALQEAVKSGDDVLLFDGGDPVARLVVSATELKSRKNFFVHYPHDASECFNSCWRHVLPAGENDAVPEGEPVGAGT